MNEPQWGSVDLDRFIATHRPALIDHFVNERGRDRAHAERVVTQALLHALVKWATFDSEERVLVWVRDLVCRRLFRHFVSDAHLLSPLRPIHARALRLRAEGLDDAALAGQLNVPAHAVPALMEAARQESERIGLHEQL